MKRNLMIASVVVAIFLLNFPVQAEPATTKPTAPSTVSSEHQKPANVDGKGLSEEKDKLLKDALAKTRIDNKSINEQIKGKRKELASLLKASTFDKTAFLSKHAEMQTLIDKSANARAEALASVAAQFNVEERKVLAERFEKKKDHRLGREQNKKSGDNAKKQ